MRRPILLGVLLIGALVLYATTGSTRDPFIPLFSNGTNFWPAKIDASTRTLQTISYEHHEAHAGSHFFFTDSNTLASGATSEYLMVVPSGTKEPHVIFSLTGSAITQISLVEGTNAAGVSVCAIRNSNRNSSTASTCILYKSSIGGSATAGATIYNIRSGAATQQSRAAMAAERSNEIILRNGVTYMFRTLSGTADNLTNIQLEWYEHTPATN